MVPNRGRNRAKDFDGLADSAPDDFDPEADNISTGVSDDDASSEDEETANGARNHYVKVDKSKLQKSKTAALGPQYRGLKISRDALTDDEEDIPFDRRFEDGESELEDDMSRRQDGDDLSSAEDEGFSGDGGSMGDGTSDTGFSDEDSTAARPRLGRAPTKKEKAQLTKAVTEDRGYSLAQSIKADAEKGRAVKKQQAAFDSLLNVRIKLQKTLVGANTIVGTPSDVIGTQQGEVREAIEAAETAALNLWSSLNSFRDHLISTRTGEKRKRAFTSSTPTEALWSHMQGQEEANLPHRNATLQRWSRKAKDTPTLPERGLINKAASQATIIDVLQENLANRSHLLKRAHTPRSCAPLQLADKVFEDPKIFDDADFYGLLLKELLEQKSGQDSVAAANIDMSKFNLIREAKTKKNVDTKASKGRKLRYTVHEKLQNFMAPEDRSTWGERQTGDLFGSLFGQRLGLGEDREMDGEMLGDDGDVDEEAGLMLFRS